MKRDLQQPALSRLEEAMIHRRKMTEIRTAMEKRKRHKQRVKAVKKAVKEFLVATGIGIALWLAFLYALISDDTYYEQQPEPRMIQAIDGDYYYLADQYESYLREREAYKEQENED